MGKKKKPNYEVVEHATREVIGVDEVRFPDSDYTFVVEENAIHVHVEFTEHILESKEEGRDLACMVHEALDKALAKFFKEG